MDGPSWLERSARSESDCGWVKPEVGWNASARSDSDCGWVKLARTPALDPRVIVGGSSWLERQR